MVVWLNGGMAVWLKSNHITIQPYDHTLSCQYTQRPNALTLKLLLRTTWYDETNKMAKDRQPVDPGRRADEAF